MTSPSMETHVWVRTDLVERLLRSDSSNTALSTWKPRRRTRLDDDWGWCRATAVKGKSDASKKKEPLRSTGFRGINHVETGAASSSLHLTIQDDIWAPPEWQGESVTVVLDAKTRPCVLTANAWWYSDEEPPEDLTRLEQLHDPSVVFCLWHRYQSDQIYTWTGKILLALNPFRPLPVYGEEVMEQYWQPNYAQRPPPHVYAIAEDAYRSMMRSITANVQNQSILVSGESGAGKTVTTKIILRYLATLSQQSTDRYDTSLEAQVLQSNPILESFGNARTLRNDNSSRFGKFMEVRFCEHGTLVSASIETYLLEKVRLVSQAPGERNYHIFYELLAGLPQADRRDLCIGNSSARDFRMTADSGTLGRRDGVLDKETYQDLREALDVMGFSADEQWDMFMVVCALLHTSNLNFVETSPDACELDTSNRSYRSAMALLGVDNEIMNDALTKCAIQARHEVVYKHLSVESAHKAVEALIKATYGALFSFIVQRINQSITAQRDDSPTAGSRSQRAVASIGVLDIFGFESFEENSFEQLCINYCNEALQQQFNRFVFKLEQQEYQREGIEWSFIAFPDNQDVLDLIEAKHEGILSTIDEQSRLPRCTDRSLALAIYDKCSKHPRFEASAAEKAVYAFSVQHFAGPVQYSTENFLEKNKDELPKETTELLKSSSHEFISELGRLLSNAAGEAPSPKTKKGHGQLKRSNSSLIRDSVGSQFSSQLRLLRTRIENTEPHYIRCLKPNEDLVPHDFEPLVIEDQLRCAGVFEAIRVSRVGYPHRYFHDHFVQRYSLLARTALQKAGRVASASDRSRILSDALAPQIADFLDDDPELFVKRGGKMVFVGIQMGKTKVFIRRQAFEALEGLRVQILEEAVVKIQSFVRMSNALMGFEIALYAARLIQRFVRKAGAYRQARIQQQFLSARTIQSSYRCFVSRRAFSAARCIAIWSQAIYKGVQAREYAAYLFLDEKSRRIQRAWSHYQNSLTFRKLRRAVITLQNRYRARVAFRELCSLRLEARDLHRVKKERDALKEETKRLLIELQQVRDTPPKATREEIRALKDEIFQLKSDLDKAHRMTTPSITGDERDALVREMETKEQLIEQLQFELANALQNSSLNGSFSARSTSMDSPAYKRPMSVIESPARSDVSLLDKDLDETDDGHFPFSSPDPIIEASGDELVHLHTSIKVGTRQLFDNIVKKSTDIVALINSGDKFGRTSLHLAVIAGDLDLVVVLLKLGAIPNMQDDDGETPLHLAEDLKMATTLLDVGKANPSIPNIDGICALHLAVQRRDVGMTRLLLMRGANVNAADHIRWFTPVHLICLPPRNRMDEHTDDRMRIADLLTGAIGTHAADLNFCDSEGNTPLHYAVQLSKGDINELVNLLLERGAEANILNERKQAPLHLLCHNDELRSDTDVYQDTLQTMLHHGADPSIQSQTGCTPLHLCLYHKDINSAVALVNKGSDLHVIWRKPKRWAAFWEEKEDGVLPLDMVQNEHALYRILAAISCPHRWGPNRSSCMSCTRTLGLQTRAIHCRHCSRLICGSCASSCLPPEFFPKNFGIREASWVCSPCEKILSSRREEMSSGTQPTSSYNDDDDDHYSC